MMKKIPLILLLLGCTLLLFPSEGDDIFREGLTAFERGEYFLGYRQFTRLVEEEPFYYYRANAVFWQAKSLYMMGDYVQAGSLLDQYLINWADNSYYEEALYLVGKNYYSQANYQSALEAFIRFSEEYGGSSWYSHALYWMGESLYGLGHIEEASQLYNRIIEEFPDSPKKEAARYRNALIEIKKREEKLLELLKWSHEEFLKSGQDSSMEKAVYEEALKAYQEQVALLSERERAMSYRNKLLSLKERTLELKTFYLDSKEAITP
jgi:tetratricopeptide (TPR) repeat protein